MNESCEEVVIKWWWEWKNENVKSLWFVWGPFLGVETTSFGWDWGNSECI